MIKSSNIRYDNKTVTQVECIELSQQNIRFLLKVKTNCNNEKKILVVMKNPSKSTKDQSDKTVNNVIRNLASKYSEIHIMNLFPYYSTKANGLLSYFDSTDNDTVLMINRMFLEEETNIVDDILIGWGTNTIGMKQCEYKKHIEDVMIFLNKSGKQLYYVHCCSCKNNLIGCGSNSNCKNRCKKLCKRACKKNPCSNIRYPMHLELWDKGKSMQPY